MIIQSLKTRAFNGLSFEAKLYINLQKNNTPEERFMHYVNYVTSVVQFRGLKIKNSSPQNLKVIMQELDNFIDLYRFQNKAVTEKLFTEALFHCMTCPELVKLLLNAGANPDFQNKRGETPLHHAASLWFTFYQKNILLSAELLASSMENTEVKNNSGKSALESINNKMGLSSKEAMLQFKADFQKVTDSPRPLYVIESPVTERNSDSVFMLSEKDRIDIELYNQAVSAYGYGSFSSKEIVLSSKGRTLCIHKFGAMYTDENLEKQQKNSLNVDNIKSLVINHIDSNRSSVHDSLISAPGLITGRKDGVSTFQEEPFTGRHNFFKVHKEPSDFEEVLSSSSSLDID